MREREEKKTQQMAFVNFFFPFILAGSWQRGQSGSSASWQSDRSSRKTILTVYGFS